MNNKIITKSIIFGVIWTAISIAIGFGISKIANFNFKDVLFVEGIILIIFSLFTSIGGNSNGLSLQSLGQTNAQYTANANLQVSKMEVNKTNSSKKTSIDFGINTISIIMAGVICILTNFLI